jgi:nitrite reductase (NO-forming)
VQITLINGEGAEHDMAEHDMNVPDLHGASQRVNKLGASSTLTFTAGNIGSFMPRCGWKKVWLAP